MSLKSRCPRNTLTGSHLDYHALSKLDHRATRFTHKTQADVVVLHHSAPSAAMRIRPSAPVPSKRTNAPMPEIHETVPAKRSPTRPAKNCATLIFCEAVAAASAARSLSLACRQSAGHLHERLGPLAHETGGSGRSLLFPQLPLGKCHFEHAMHHKVGVTADGAREVSSTRGHRAHSARRSPTGTQHAAEHAGAGRSPAAPSACHGHRRPRWRWHAAPPP